MILPLGSVEQHGNHMPLGTDTLLAHAVSLAAAESLPGTRRRAAAALVRIFGASHALSRLASRCRAETLMAVVEDIVASLVGHGFRRILIVNGHGGNSGVIDVLASTLGHKHYGDARIAALTYFQLAREAIAKLRESKPGGMGHACEFETAMMQHIRPELVQMEQRRDHLSRSGLALPDHRPARRLGDPHLPRFRRPLAERHARRSVARHAREGREVLRGGGRRTRRLHRGFPRLDHSGARGHEPDAQGRRHRARLFRRRHARDLCRASGRRTGRASATAIRHARAESPATPARRALTTSPRCSRCPDSMPSASACPTGCMKRRPSPRPRPARRSCSKSRSPMTPRRRAASSTRSRRAACG